jgi:hypothetical protein
VFTLPPQEQEEATVALAAAAAAACTARAALDLLVAGLAASRALELQLPPMALLGLALLLRVSFRADMLQRGRQGPLYARDWLRVY